MPDRPNESPRDADAPRRAGATGRADRRRLEDALFTAASAVSTDGGDAIFRDLTAAIARILAVDVAFIAVFADGSRDRVRTLAAMLDGAVLRNFEYDLVGTPCVHVVGRAFRMVGVGASREFPAGTIFHAKGMDSYAAYPLSGSAGEPLGLIVTMARAAMKDDGLAEALLRIFAARAAAEIERVRTEQAIRASELQYRSIFDAAVDGLALWDADGRVVDVNPAFARLFGVERGELVGRDGGTVLVDEPRGGAHPFLADVLAGEARRSEMQALRRDGTTFDVEVRGVAMHYRDRPHALVIVRDLTREREAERARAALEARLRQAQKMEAIGHLTGGIAHDFNNLLTTILGYVTLASESTADPRLQRYLGEARTASVRARDLIAQMLTSSRGRRGDARPLALESVAGEVIRLVRSSFPSTVSISTAFAGDLPAVVADPVQVEQVVLNLCLNARDAMGGHGEIRARIGRARIAGHACASCRATVSGEFVELAIEDTGPGVPLDVQERMFDPFFTTKEVGRGTGMGLATVHGIVHECGGHVLLERGPEGGARFRVLFPAAGRVPANAGPSTGKPEAIPRGTLAGRVVLVDDEPAVAGFMRELLSEWGLAPRVFRDPAEALAAVAADPSAVDVVLTDQSMPGMTGLDLARACKDLPDSPPVILYTGYAENLSEGALETAGVAALVRKPIDPPALFETLETFLRGASARPAERRARI